MTTRDIAATFKEMYGAEISHSLISFIRKSINHRKNFPNDQSALKVVYLAIQKVSQKWTMSLHDWRAAMNRFAIEFDGRFS